jgi:hypothetical protein
MGRWTDGRAGGSGQTDTPDGQTGCAALSVPWPVLARGALGFHLICSEEGKLCVGLGFIDSSSRFNYFLAFFPFATSPNSIIITHHFFNPPLQPPEMPAAAPRTSTTSTRSASRPFATSAKVHPNILPFLQTRRSAARWCVPLVSGSLLCIVLTLLPPGCRPSLELPLPHMPPTHTARTPPCAERPRWSVRRTRGDGCRRN